MQPRDGDRNHGDYQDLLGAHVLGATTPEERWALVAHLATCAACRRELAGLRAAVQALPLTIDEREPSPALRERIRAAVLGDRGGADSITAHERTPLPLPSPGARIALPTPPSGVRSGRRFATPWAAAVALLLASSLGLLVWNVRLQQAVQRPEAVEAVALRLSRPATGAGGRLAFLEEREATIVAVRGLPPLSPGLVYELWPVHDGAPASTGRFVLDGTGAAVAAVPAIHDPPAILPVPGLLDRGASGRRHAPRPARRPLPPSG